MTTQTQTESRITAFSWLIAIVVFILSMSLVGCGDEETTTAVQPVAVQTPPRPTPVSVTPEPEVQPIPEPEPELVAVQTPPKEVTYEEAAAAYREARYEEAVALFTQYTARKDTNPWGYYMLGLSARKVGQLEQAENAFAQALEIDPAHVKSWTNLSRVHLDAGRPEAAILSLDTALAIDAESNDVHRLRGRAYHQLGSTEEAIEAYRQALVIDSEDAWSMNNLAFIHLEEERFEMALPILALAVELRDDVDIFYNNLGMALERTGHYEAAQEMYTAATQINDSYDKAMINLARAEHLVENAAVNPVDLEVLAQGFRDEIAQWRTGEIAAAQPADDQPTEVIVPEVVLEVISDTEIVPETPLASVEADSTSGTQEQ